MIIWGSSGDTVDLGHIGTRYCETCGQDRPFSLVLQYRYWGLYWIFNFVTAKQYWVVCDACNRGWKIPAKTIPPNLSRIPIPFMRRYGLAVLGASIAVIVALVSETGSPRATTARDSVRKALSGIHNMTPYAFMKRAYERGGPDFRVAYVRGVQFRLNNDSPGAKLAVADRAAFDDLGSAIRGVVYYMGTMPIDGVGVCEVIGQTRQYFHSSGVSKIEALCLTELSSCSGMSGLVEMAESALMPNLASSGVGAILPSRGACSIDTLTDSLTGQPFDTAMCWYEAGTILTFSRSNQHETIQALAGLADVPGFRTLLEEILNDAR